MADFVIIGSNEQMKDIVEGVYAHLPHPTPHNVSTGLLLHKEKPTDGNIARPTHYQSQYSNTHETQEAPSLQQYIENHLAHHRIYSARPDIPLNVFILCSCYDEQDFEDMQFIAQNINDLPGTAQDIIVTWIFFSFDTKSRPGDVTLRAERDIIHRLIESNQQLFCRTNENAKDSLSLVSNRICYLNNIDIHGEALPYPILLNPEDKDRDYHFWSEAIYTLACLCSNCDDKYNIQNAINNSSNKHNIFSFGYAEFMYRYRDVTRYMQLVVERQLLEKVLGDSETFPFISGWQNDPFDWEELRQLSKVYPNPHNLKRRHDLLEQWCAMPHEIEEITQYDELIKQEAEKDAKKTEVEDETQTNKTLSLFYTLYDSLREIQEYIDLYNAYCDRKREAYEKVVIEAEKAYQMACKAYEEDEDNTDNAPQREDFFKDVPREEDLPKPIAITYWDDVLEADKAAVTRKDKAVLAELLQGYTEQFHEAWLNDLDTKLLHTEIEEATDDTEQSTASAIPDEQKKGCFGSWIRRLFGTADSSADIAPSLTPEEIAAHKKEARQQQITGVLQRMMTVLDVKADIERFMPDYDALVARKKEIDRQIDAFEPYEEKRSIAIIDKEKLYPYFESICPQIVAEEQKLREEIEKKGYAFIEDQFDFAKCSEKLCERIEYIWMCLDWHRNTNILIKEELTRTEVESKIPNLTTCINTLYARSAIFADVYYDEHAHTIGDKISPLLYSNDKEQQKNIQECLRRNYLDGQSYYSHHAQNKLCMFRFIQLQTDEIRDLQRKDTEK